MPPKHFSCSAHLCFIPYIDKNEEEQLERFWFQGHAVNVPESFAITILGIPSRNSPKLHDCCIDSEAGLPKFYDVTLQCISNNMRYGVTIENVCDMGSGDATRLSTIDHKDWIETSKQKLNTRTVGKISHVGMSQDHTCVSLEFETLTLLIGNAVQPLITQFYSSLLNNSNESIDEFLQTLRVCIGHIHVNELDWHQLD